MIMRLRKALRACVTLYQATIPSRLETHAPSCVGCHVEMPPICNSGSLGFEEISVPFACSDLGNEWTPNPLGRIVYILDRPWS